MRLDSTVTAVYPVIATSVNPQSALALLKFAIP